jgi:hypothetical protein
MFGLKNVSRRKILFAALLGVLAVRAVRPKRGRCLDQ